MSIINEKEIIKVISDDDNKKLISIFNNYFKYIACDDNITFEKSVTNNMLIGYGYNIFKDKVFWDDILMRNMKIIREEVLKNKLGREVFPDTKLIDTLYSSYFVWRNTGYFEKFIYSLNQYLVDLTHIYIKYFYENKHNVGYNFFSLSSGLASICNYLLEFGYEYQSTIEQLLQIFVSIIYEENSNKSRIYKQIDTDEKTLDFSLSNGIAGILLVMAKSYSKNIVVSGQIESIKNIILTYQEYAKRIDTITYWPGLLKLDTKENSENMYNMKETWSYGALSIARVLYLVGKCLKDYKLTDWANKIIIEKSRMFLPEFIVTNGSLLTGYTGLLCIFDAMYRDDVSIRYLKMNNELLKKVLDLYANNQEPKFKFKRIELISGEINEAEYFHDNTIREGYTGILLSLLSTFSNVKDLLHPYMGIR